MHQINNNGILYSAGGKGFLYPLFLEYTKGDMFRDFTGDVLEAHSTLKKAIEDVKSHYKRTGHYDESKNTFIMSDALHFSSCSLFDIAFTRQDRNDPELNGRFLVSTEVSHTLRGAYNNGAIQILTVDGMEHSLIEKAVRKIHTEEIINPYLLAQGITFRKKEAEWKGAEWNYVIV